MLGWIGNDQSMKMRETSRGLDKKLDVNNSPSQVPFSSLNIGLPKNKNGARVCMALLEEYDKGMGKGEQMIFPNIIFRCKKGINKNPNDPYYYLYDKACDVASRHMNPTFMNIDSKINMELWKKGITPAIMG